VTHKKALFRAFFVFGVWYNAPQCPLFFTPTQNSVTLVTASLPFSYFIWNMQGIRTSPPSTKKGLSVLLIGLLLLAPCKVRNTLESSLGLTTTKVTNKIKATTASKTCCASFVTVSTSKGKEVNTQPLPFLPVTTTALAALGSTRSQQLLPTANKVALPPSVPLYILYHQFKGYL